MDTREFLDLCSRSDTTVRVIGLQEGTFALCAEIPEGPRILASDGRCKEFPSLDHVADWLQRNGVQRVILDLGIWTDSLRLNQRRRGSRPERRDSRKTGECRAGKSEAFTMLRGMGRVDNAFLRIRHKALRSTEVLGATITVTMFGEDPDQGPGHGIGISWELEVALRHGDLRSWHLELSWQDATQTWSVSRRLSMPGEHGPETLTTFSSVTCEADSDVENVLVKEVGELEATLDVSAPGRG